LVRRGGGTEKKLRFILQGGIQVGRRGNFYARLLGGKTPEEKLVYKGGTLSSRPRESAPKSALSGAGGFRIPRHINFIL